MALDPEALEGGPATVYVGELPKASYTTANGTNKDFKVEAIDGGVDGNSIQIAVVDPTGNNVALSVAVSGAAPAYTITVTGETNGSSALVSTAAEVVAAINAHPSAQGIVTACLKATQDGSGVVVALAATPLAGGSDTAVYRELGYLGGPIRVTPSVTTTDYRGQQAGRAPIKRLIAEAALDLEITIAELSLANLAVAFPNTVLLDDGTSKKRLEWRDMIGRDLLKAARRWEVRPYINGAETADAQQILVLPKAAPATNQQPFVYDVDNQRVVTFTLNAYPDSLKRRAFRGNETF